MKIKLFTIPNLLTLSNLLCGAFAAVAALVWDDLTLAFWLVVAAAVFDFFDGFVARLIGQASPIGVELDSLADDISFGFAPAAVLYVLFGRMTGLWITSDYAGLAVFVFAAFAALRLAKFNIDDTQHTEFCGLPTPAATLFCVSLGLLAETRALTMPREAVLVVAVALSLLMISPLRMFALKFRGFGWKENRVRYSFIAGSALLVVLLGSYSIPAIIVLYLMISLVRALFCKGDACTKEG